jgi:deoxyribodipyrimidine photo-lyase
VTAYPPVGPVADRLAALAPGLAAAGVPLVRRIGAWDRAFWPFAQKGFFALKAEIPPVLADLGYPVDKSAAAAFGAKPGPARKPKGSR